MLVMSSLLGPHSFHPHGYFDENGNRIDGTYIPDGARFDPYGPSGDGDVESLVGYTKPRLPPGFPPPKKPQNPAVPPLSRPNPDHLPMPGFYDLYYVVWNKHTRQRKTTRMP